MPVQYAVYILLSVPECDLSFSNVRNLFDNLSSCWPIIILKIELRGHRNESTVLDPRSQTFVHHLLDLHHIFSLKHTTIELFHQLAVIFLPFLSVVASLTHSTPAECTATNNNNRNWNQRQKNCCLSFALFHTVGYIAIRNGVFRIRAPSISADTLVRKKDVPISSLDHFTMAMVSCQIGIDQNILSLRKYLESF